MSLNLPTGFSRTLIGLLIFVAANGIGCQKNYFQGFGTQTDDESLFYTAREYLRGGSYTSAVNSCLSLSANYLAKDDVAIICASAYAGRAGYSLQWFETNLPTLAAPITKTMFNSAALFKSISAATATTYAADCDSAEVLLRGIGKASARSKDANMFMALLAIYKMGLVVKSIADANSDGTLDGGFDSCLVASLSTANQKLIGSAFWELNSSLSQLGSVTFVSAIKTAVTAMCTGLAAITDSGAAPGTGLAEDLCGGTNPAALSGDALMGVKTLVKEGAAFGVDQCGGGASIATCQCL